MKRSVDGIVSSVIQAAGCWAERSCPIQGEGVVRERNQGIHPSSTSSCYSAARWVQRWLLLAAYPSSDSSAAVLHARSHRILRPAGAGDNCSSPPDLGNPSSCPGQSRNSCASVLQYCPDQTRVLPVCNRQGQQDQGDRTTSCEPCPFGASRTCRPGRRGRGERWLRGPRRHR